MTDLAVSSIPAQTDAWLAGGGAVVFSTALWAVIGGLLGAALAPIVWFTLRALGAYRWDWRWAGVIRGLTLAWMIVAGVFLCGALGAVSGARGAYEAQLRSGPLSEEVLPKLGELGADGAALAMAHLPLADGGAGNALQPTDDPIEAFRSGKWELNVAELRARLDKLPENIAAEGVGPVKREILKRRPDLVGTAAEGVLDRLLPGLIEWFVRRKLEKKVDEYGVADLLDDLSAEAAKSGDPNTVSHAELGRFLTEHAAVPILTAPVRAAAKQATRTAWLALAAAFLLPVVFFRIADAIRGRDEPNPTPPLPAAVSPVGKGTIR